MKIASLDPAPYSQATPARAGFRYSDGAFSKIAERSELLAMLVRNITSDCRTGEAIEISPAKPVDLGGMANQGAATYEYKGTFVVRQRKLLLDVEFVRTDARATVAERKLRTHVEISEDGTVRDL